MDVFIGNLPSSVTLHDIRLACRKWDFDAHFEQRKGVYKIGKPYHYFVAHFDLEQEAEAQRLIRRLRNISFLGRAVEAREYITRSYSQERRMPGWRDRLWYGVERRLGERRSAQGLMVA